MSYQPNQNFYYSTELNNIDGHNSNKRLEEFRRRHEESNLRHEAYFKDSNLKSKVENSRLYQAYVENSDKKILNYSTNIEDNNHTSILTEISRHSAQYPPTGAQHYNNHNSAAIEFHSNPSSSSYSYGMPATAISCDPYAHQSQTNNNFKRHYVNMYEGINSKNSSTLVAKRAHSFNHSSTLNYSDNSSMTTYGTPLPYAQTQYGPGVPMSQHSAKIALLDAKPQGTSYGGGAHQAPSTAQYSYQKAPTAAAAYNGYHPDSSAYYQQPPFKPILSHSEGGYNQPGIYGNNPLVPGNYPAYGNINNNPLNSNKLHPTISTASRPVPNGAQYFRANNKPNPAFESSMGYMYDPSSSYNQLTGQKYSSHQGYAAPFTYANQYDNGQGDSRHQSSYMTPASSANRHGTLNDLAPLCEQPYKGAPFTPVKPHQLQQHHYPFENSTHLPSTQLDGSNPNSKVSLPASSHLFTSAVPGGMQAIANASMPNSITMNKHINNTYPVSPSHHAMPGAVSKVGAPNEPLAAGTPVKSGPTSKEEKAAARKHYRQMLKAQKRAALAQDGQSNSATTKNSEALVVPEVVRTKRKYNTSNHNKHGKAVATDNSATSNNKGVNQQLISANDKITNHHLHNQPLSTVPNAAPTQLTGLGGPTTANNIQAFLDTYEITDDLINNGDAFGDIVFGASALSGVGAQHDAFIHPSQNTGAAFTTSLSSSKPISKMTPIKSVTVASTTYQGGAGPRPPLNHETLLSTARLPPSNSNLNDTNYNNSSTQSIHQHLQFFSTSNLGSMAMTSQSSSLANPTASGLSRISSYQAMSFTHSQLYEEESHLVKMNRLVDINTGVTVNPLHGPPENNTNNQLNLQSNNANNSKNHYPSAATVPKKSNAGRKRTKNIPSVKNNNTPPKVDAHHGPESSSSNRLSNALLGNVSASSYSQSLTNQPGNMDNAGINNLYEFEIKPAPNYNYMGHAVRQPPAMNLKESSKHLFPTRYLPISSESMPRNIAWSDSINTNRHSYPFPTNPLSHPSNKPLPNIRPNTIPKRDGTSFLGENGQQNTSRATHLHSYLSRPPEHMSYNTTNYTHTTHFPFYTGQINAHNQQSYQYAAPSGYLLSAQSKSFPSSSLPSHISFDIPISYSKNAYPNPSGLVRISSSKNHPTSLDDLLSHNPPPPQTKAASSYSPFGLRENSQTNCTNRPNDLELRLAFPSTGSAIASVDEFEMLLMGNNVSNTAHHDNPKTPALSSTSNRDYLSTGDGLLTHHGSEISPTSCSSAAFDLFKPPSGGGAGSSATSGIASCSSSLSTASSNNSSVTTPEDLMNQQLAHERSILCEFAATADFFSA